MKKSPINKIGKKGKQDRKELDKITPELMERSGGVCEHCGKAPDWRGFQRVHIIARSQGGDNSLKNVQLWCCPCHYGKDGHRTELEIL